MNHTLKKFIVVSLLVSPLAIGSAFAKDACRKDKSAKKECKKNRRKECNKDRKKNCKKKERRCCTPKKGQKAFVGLWQINALVTDKEKPPVAEAIAKLFGHVAIHADCTGTAVVDTNRMVALENLINADSTTSLGLWKKGKKGKRCFKALFTALVDLNDVEEAAQFTNGTAELKIAIDVKVSKDGCSFFGKGTVFILPSGEQEETERPGLKFGFTVKGGRIQIKKMKKRRPNCK